jgi:hypothetical protein
MLGAIQCRTGWPLKCSNIELPADKLPEKSYGSSTTGTSSPCGNNWGNSAFLTSIASLHPAAARIL